MNNEYGIKEADVEKLERYLTEEEMNELYDTLEELQRIGDVFNIDMNIGRYRFIQKCGIDEALKDELLNDKYLLGSFEPWFIADITKLNYDTVKDAQQKGLYTLLGEIMAQHIDDIVDEYVSTDGYGGHFAIYDSNEHEITNWYFFRVE